MISLSDHIMTNEHCLTLTVDLLGKNDEQSVIEAIENAFGNYYTVSSVPNWDGFNDDLRSFKGFSDVWTEAIARQPNLNALHLVIINAHDLKKQLKKIIRYSFTY